MLVFDPEQCEDSQKHLFSEPGQTTATEVEITGDTGRLSEGLLNPFSGLPGRRGAPSRLYSRVD